VTSCGCTCALGVARVTGTQSAIESAPRIVNRVRSLLSSVAVSLVLASGFPQNASGKPQKPLESSAGYFWASGYHNATTRFSNALPLYPRYDDAYYWPDASPSKIPAWPGAYRQPHRPIPTEWNADNPQAQFARGAFLIGARPYDQAQAAGMNVPQHGPRSASPRVLQTSLDPAHRPSIQETQKSPGADPHRPRVSLQFAAMQARARQLMLDQASELGYLILMGTGFLALAAGVRLRSGHENQRIR
jgi:hypothetical protein